LFSQCATRAMVTGSTEVMNRLVGERNMEIADVARETELNRNTITLLYKETATRVDLDAIEKLCELFECEVGQLLERTKK
jgi:putative transcriptional regulator